MYVILLVRKILKTTISTIENTCKICVYCTTLMSFDSKAVTFLIVSSPFMMLPKTFEKETNLVLY